jgi:hypothetical protein
MSRVLWAQILDFCMEVFSGKHTEVIELARILQKLADLAWDEVDEQYQGTIRIDP